MNRRILITGSEGLIGSEIVELLTAEGYEVVQFDLRAIDSSSQGDIRDQQAVCRAITGSSGIIHLAAISRVVWGERNPDLCWETNVKGTENILTAALQMDPKPWVIFSSSREVYGHSTTLPASEDAQLAPVNIYGKSKAAGEDLVNMARKEGLTTAIVRFSNVYGSTGDYCDRVVPAFAYAASQGSPLRVDGADHTFDFTHLDDTVRGVISLIQILETGTRTLPPIHFLTGSPTTLGELASMAVELANCNSAIVHAPPRSYDVARFYGDPTRARDLLDWLPHVNIREGMKRLILAYRERDKKEYINGTAA